MAPKHRVEAFMVAHTHNLDVPHICHRAFHGQCLHGADDSGKIYLSVHTILKVTLYGGPKSQTYTNENRIGDSS
jgi:hypothetical protein